MDIEAGKSSFIVFLLYFLKYSEGFYRNRSQLPWLVLQLQVLHREEHLIADMDIQRSSHTVCSCCYFSPPRLAASVIVITMLIIALTRSLQILAYVYFTVATMPHLLEASTS